MIRVEQDISKSKRTSHFFTKLEHKVWNFVASQ